VSFQDDFVAALSRSGVALAAGAAPSRESLEAGLTKLNTFIGSLDSDTAAALEEITTEFPIKALLSDPAVNIAPELNLVLKAFDQANARFSISEFADICQRPLLSQTPLPSRPGAPNITTVQPEQFTLSNTDSSIFIAWSVSEICDKYHFMWTDRIPTPPFAGGWNAIEFTAHGSHGFATRIPKTSIGTTYTFKVQGCKAFDLGSDLCGPFCADSNITMPGNTHSLRTFLQLSNVLLAAGVRSLGTPVFGAGFRAMMRV
jgi:hypothetical protein